MTERPDHSRLIARYALSAELVCDTAVHVGTGGSSSDVRATSDMPVARDGAGRPFVPGSSFRGALRAGLEAILRGLGRPPEELRVCDPFSASCSELIKEAKKQREKDKQPAPLTEVDIFDVAWEESCEICRIFGNTFLASRLRIADLELVGDPEAAGVYVRDGVGLDRDLRTAAKGILYNFEAVPAGVRFQLRLDLENPMPYELGLVLTGLDLFGHGFLNIGGKRARGLGMASIELASASFKRWTAQDFFDREKRNGTDVGAHEEARFRDEARTFYLGEGA